MLTYVLAADGSPLMHYNIKKVRQCKDGGVIAAISRIYHRYLALPIKSPYAES